MPEPTQGAALGDLPSRIMGWVGKARARGLTTIYLDFETVNRLLSAARGAAASEARIAALEAALREIERAPAWGYPDIARQALAGTPSHDDI